MEEKTERFVMRVSPEFLRMVDDWRRMQDEIPSRSDAVRQLTILGMTHTLEQRYIADLFEVCLAQLQAGSFPEDARKKVEIAFQKLGNSRDLSERLIESLEGLKNLPPADPLPARKPRKPKPA